MDHYNLQKLQLIAATCVGFDLLWRFFRHKKATLFACFFSCLLQLNHLPLLIIREGQILYFNILK